MKIESAAGTVVLFTAYWVVCAFAYISGVFVRYDSILIGILKFDEVLISASGKIATVFAILLPIYAVVQFAAVKFAKSKNHFSVFSSSFALMIAFGVTVACVALYFLAVRSGIYIPDVLYVFLMSAPIGIVGLVGISYDVSSKTIRGRVLSLSFVGLMSSFSSGAEPRLFPEAGEQRCVAIYSGDKLKVSGPLIYAAQSAIFIKEPSSGSLSYYKVEDFDRLSSAPCKKGQQ